MAGKKISELTDATAVNTDTLFEISEPVKSTATDGTVTITGYKSLRASIAYIIALLKNTAMSFPWLSVKGMDQLGEIDTANGMQVTWKAAPDGGKAETLTDQPAMSVTGYGRALFKMPFYGSDIGFIVTDDQGNVSSFVQAAKKDLSNVDTPTLVKAIDTQRGSAPVLTKGDQSIEGTLELATAFPTLVTFRENQWSGLNFYTGSLQRYSILTNPSKDVLVFSTYDDNGNLQATPLNITRDGTIVQGGSRPSADNTTWLGHPSFRWSAVWSSNGTIQTSDERLKDNIASIPDAVLDVWELLSPWCQFTMSDSTNDSPRLHLGAIAQRVIKAFSDAGLDAFDYGLACYDKWEESTQQEFDKMVEVVDPDTGEKTQQPVYKTVTIPAGDRYSLRYDECLVLEGALMRRTTERLAARVAKLEQGNT